MTKEIKEKIELRHLLIDSDVYNIKKKPQIGSLMLLEITNNNNNINKEKVINYNNNNNTENNLNMPIINKTLNESNKI